MIVYTMKEVAAILKVDVKLVYAKKEVRGAKRIPGTKVWRIYAKDDAELLDNIFLSQKSHSHSKALTTSNVVAKPKKTTLIPNPCLNDQNKDPNRHHFFELYNKEAK